MKVKKEVEFWDINDMYKYALRFYSINEEEDDYYGTYKNTTISRITERLKECKFVPIKTNDSQKKYQLPVDMAKFFIDTMMYDYFTGDATARKEKSRKRAEEARDRTLKTMEIKSLEKDRQMEIEKGAGDIKTILYDEIMNNPTDVTNIRMKEKLDSSKFAEWTEKKHHILANGKHVLKKSFEYHLPEVTTDELNDEMVDKIVDRTMLRAIFYELFDFKEKDFRQAVYERSAHIEEKNVNGIKPKDGYSELTRQLENPIGFYITRKKDNEK